MYIGLVAWDWHTWYVCHCHATIYTIKFYNAEVMGKKKYAKQQACTLRINFDFANVAEMVLIVMSAYRENDKKTKNKLVNHKSLNCSKITQSMCNQ